MLSPNCYSVTGASTCADDDAPCAWAPGGAGVWEVTTRWLSSDSLPRPPHPPTSEACTIKTSWHAREPTGCLCASPPSFEPLCALLESPQKPPVQSRGADKHHEVTNPVRDGT